MPRKAWNDKQERQFEHVKQSGKKRGQSARQAESMAARVVNKQRAQKGVTKPQARKSPPAARNKSARGNLQERTKKELYAKAKQLDIGGRSRMNKDELVQAIRKHR